MKHKHYALQPGKTFIPSAHIQFKRNSYQIPTVTFLELYDILCSMINFLFLVFVKQAFRNFPTGSFAIKQQNAHRLNNNVDVIILNKYLGKS